MRDALAISGRVQHLTLCVRDEQEAREFYTRALGLTEAHDRPDLPVSGLWLQIGEFQIHLIVPVDPAELPKPRTLDRTPLASHTAFEVDALEPLVERLRAQGTNVIFSEFAKEQAFLCDPSGNLIELNAPSVLAGRG